MKSLHEARMHLRKELEAPPALRRFGSGWVSGVLSVVLGLGGLFCVLTLRLPGVFSMPELAKMEETTGFRVFVLALLTLAFLFAMLSLVLRDGKALGTTGMAATLLAAMLGGSASTAAAPDYTPLYFGLDFFVLRLLFTGFIFIPIETLFPRRRE